MAESSSNIQNFENKEQQLNKMKSNHASEKALAKEDIGIDIRNFETAINVIKKNIKTMEEECGKIKKLKEKSSNTRWTTLNKGAYELFLENEEKYLNESVSLMKKIVKFCNEAAETMVEMDKKLIK